MSKCTRCGKENPAEIHTCTPLALRLADRLHCGDDKCKCSLNEAAAELRRLYALNAELVEALEAAAAYTALLDGFTQDAIRAALAKAKEQT
jgi:hypothetical protein